MRGKDHLQDEDDRWFMKVYPKILWSGKWLSIQKVMPKELETKATGCHNPEGHEQLLLKKITASRSLLWAWIKIRVLLAYAKRLLGTVTLRSTAVVLVRKGHEVCPTHSCWVWNPTRHPTPCQVLRVCNITEYPTLNTSPGLPKRGQPAATSEKILP